MALRKGAHCAYDLCYHVTFITKYRRKFLTPGVYAYFAGCLNIIAKRHPQMKVLLANHERDHIHLLLSLPPSMPVSKAVQLIKCNTSRVMKRRLTFLKRMYADRGVWGEGYYVGSTGRDIRAVGQYIERQGGNALAKPVFPEYRPHYFLPRPGKHSQ